MHRVPRLDRRAHQRILGRDLVRPKTPDESIEPVEMPGGPIGDVLTVLGLEPRHRVSVARLDGGGMLDVGGFD